MFRTFFIMDLRLVSKYVEHESWSVLRTLRFVFKLRFVLCVVERNIEVQTRKVEADEMHGVTRRTCLARPFILSSSFQAYIHDIFLLKIML